MSSEKKYGRELARLASNIKKLRTDASLTQEDMIKHGFNYRHYQKLESGKAQRPIRIMGTWYRYPDAALDVKPDIIVQGIIDRKLTPYLFVREAYFLKYDEVTEWSYTENLTENRFVEVLPEAVSRLFFSIDEKFSEDFPYLLLSNGETGFDHEEQRIENLCFIKEQFQVLFRNSIYIPIDGFKSFVFKNQTYALSENQARILEKMFQILSDPTIEYVKNNKIFDGTDFTGESIKKEFKAYPELIGPDGLIIPLEDKQGYFKLHSSAFSKRY